MAEAKNADRQTDRHAKGEDTQVPLIAVCCWNTTDNR